MRSILLLKKLLGLVEMTSGLVNVSFSLPEWQAVKMIFFTPWYVLEDLCETMLTTCVLLTMSKTPAPANIQAKLCETQTHHNINRELN